MKLTCKPSHVATGRQNTDRQCRDCPLRQQAPTVTRVTRVRVSDEVARRIKRTWQ